MKIRPLYFRCTLDLISPTQSLILNENWCFWVGIACPNLLPFSPPANPANPSRLAILLEPQPDQRAFSKLMTAVFGSHLLPNRPAQGKVNERRKWRSWNSAHVCLAKDFIDSPLLLQIVRCRSAKLIPFLWFISFWVLFFIFSWVHFIWVKFCGRNLLFWTNNTDNLR